jgi:transcriptional regulator with XRE-family HTH domain
MRPKATKKTDYERLVAQEALILDATETIVGLLEEQGISRRELATRLGKSKGFVSQLLSGERNMTLRTLADLGYVLGYRFSLSLRNVAEQLAATGASPEEMKPRDQESRAETPLETVEDWTHRSGADAHEYALAA